MLTITSIVEITTSNSGEVQLHASFLMRRLCIVVLGLLAVSLAHPLPLRQIKTRCVKSRST